MLESPPPNRLVPPITFDPGAYGQWFETELGRRVRADEERALLAVLEPQRGWRVLDAACGDGRLLLSMARQGMQVVGADPSMAMLRAAREHARAAGLPVHLVCADAHALPFADESFDAVTAVTALCFVPDAGPVLTEIVRAIRQGGRLVIGELGRWSLWAGARRLRGWIRGGIWTAARFHTGSGLQKLVRTAGLNPSPVRGAVYYPRSAALARLLYRVDDWLGRKTTFGAAFLAVSGVKEIAR